MHSFCCFSLLTNGLGFVQAMTTSARAAPRRQERGTDGHRLWLLDLPGFRVKSNSEPLLLCWCPAADAVCAAFPVGSLVGLETAVKMEAPCRTAVWDSWEVTGPRDPATTSLIADLPPVATGTLTVQVSLSIQQGPFCKLLISLIKGFKNRQEKLALKLRHQAEVAIYLVKSYANKSYFFMPCYYHNQGYIVEGIESRKFFKLLFKF